VGFGRFGQAFATLLADAGHTVSGWDPVAPVAADFAATSLPAAVEVADIVLVCPPVLHIEEAVRLIRPMLRSDHLVADVSSVRAPAEAAMAQLLGDAIPWVGTHPLFGPSSIARGDRHLRAVVCPNDHHPLAAARMADLYRSVGCTVDTQDPDEHDRSMAYTHALAFFVAKGLIDLDVMEKSAFVPPSFRAMAQTLEAVRSDAGHLFYAIERLNPHAGDARSHLMAALERVHAELERLDPDTVRAVLTQADAAEELSAFQIPGLGQEAPALKQARDLIDEVDREMVELLARRQALAVRAGHIKGAQRLPVQDPARERRLLDSRAQWAREAGLDAGDVERLFESLMRMSRRAQHEVREPSHPPV